ncbi:MAG: autotransporter-associated beta strand repeat-containing protein, partial [Acidobacteriota bacterium]
MISGEGLTIEGNGQTPIIFSGQLSGAGGITTRVPITLSGDNTLTGPIIGTTSVSGAPYAIIRVTNPAALGPAGSAPVEIRGDRLELYGGITVTGKAISLGTFFGYNQGLVSSGGANAWTGRIDIFSNSYLKTASSTDSLTITGPIDGHNQPYLDVYGAGDILISGSISNLTQALDKHDTGTLTLAGNNTYSASTYITKGTVVLRGGNAIGDNSAVLLEVYSPDTATLRLEADETIGHMRGQRSTIDLGEHTLRINQLYDGQTYSGTFVGSGKIVKAGPAAIQFYTPNSHTGGTVIEAGTLQIREDACLGAASAPTVLIEGTLQWTGPASGALDSKRTIKLSSSGMTSNNFDANGKTFSVPGPITGPGALTKVGQGTLVLSNSQNNYAGGTRIVSGAIQFDQSEAIAGSGPNIFIAVNGQAAAGYPIDQFFLQRIDPTSSGVVALSTASSNDLDFGSAQLVNVYL